MKKIDEGKNENGNRFRLHFDADVRFGNKDKVQTKTYLLLTTASTALLIVLYRLLQHFLENLQ